MERVCDQYWNMLLTDYLTGIDAPLHPLRDLTVFSPYMTYLGRVRRFVPYKDKVRKCKVFDEFVRAGAIRYEEKYQMAVPNREAMTISIAKYNRPQPVIDEKVFELANDWTQKHFQQWMGNSKTVSHDIARRDLDRQTSAGYPWSLFWRNKGQFLDSEEAPKIEKLFWDNLIMEQPFEAFWTASLKHELRPVEKLKENKIRTFTASATEATVAATRLFLDMNEKFYTSNNKTWSFVGCSKYNRGFDRLYRRLQKFEKNCFELDETAFDSSLFVRAMEGVRDLRFKFLHDSEKTPENEKRVKEIYRQIIHSLIVLDDGVVMQKHTGNPSGSANTIVDNTLILFMLFAYAYIILALKYCAEKANYADFMNFVEAALNGDDNTFGVSESIVKWFNARNIAEEWSKIGVITKSPCFDPRPLSECEFLSHRFQKYKNCWIPVPEKDKALCSLMWGQEFDDVRFTLLRAYALRIETWGDVQCRKDIQAFIDYIRKEYASELVGEIPDTELTMKIIDSVWKTDAEIERLYTLPPVLEVKAKRHDKNFISLTNKYGLLADWEEDELHESFVTQSEVVKQNLQNHLMPKGKGNKKKKGGNPSKAEMKRRQAQSQRDKQHSNKKADNRAHRREKLYGKGPPQGGFKNFRTQRAPINSGRQQVNINGLKTREHKHSTFIGAFTTTTDGKFTEMVSFPFNPAQQACDPWGFPIAGRYEAYGRKKGVAPFRIRIEPRVAATTDGETFVSLQYNTVAGAPTTSQQLLQHSKASRSNAWMKNSIVCEYDAVAQKNRYYCRPGSQPANTDIREYDMANVYIFYEGITAAKTYDVWIDIDVLLFDPWIPTDGEVPNIADFLHLRATWLGGGSLTFTRVSGNGLLDYEMIGSSSSMQFNILNGIHSKGYYLITVNWKAVAGTFTTNITPNSLGGALLITGFCEDGADNAKAFTGGHAMCQVLAAFPDDASAASGAVTFAPPTGIAANDVVDVTVTFVGYANSFTAAPTVSQKRTKRATIGEISLKEDVIKSLISDPLLLAQLKKLIVDNSEGYLKVSTPSTPEPSTALAAGGKPAPSSLNLDEKSSGAPTQQGKSKLKK